MKPLPKAALFCANLPDQFTDADLKLQLNQLFSRYGKVHHVKLNRDRQNRLGAFVQFQLSTHADLALNQANRIYLKDRLLRVERARVNRSLRVSQTSLDSAAVEALFKRYGDIESFLTGPVSGPTPEESASQGEYVVRFKYRDDCMSAWFANRQSTTFSLCWAHERHPYSHSHSHTRNTQYSVGDKRSFPPLAPSQPSQAQMDKMTQPQASQQEEQQQQQAQVQSHTQAAQESLERSMASLDLATGASKDHASSAFLATRSESYPEMRDQVQPEAHPHSHPQTHSDTHQQTHTHESPNTPSHFIPSTPQLSPDMNDANQSMETTYPLTPPQPPLYDVRPPRKAMGRGGGQFESRRGGFRRNTGRPPRPNNGKRHYLNMRYMDNPAAAATGNTSSESGATAAANTGTLAGYYHPSYSGQNMNQGYYPQSAPTFIPYPQPQAINFGQPIMTYPYPMQPQGKSDGSPASADKMMGGGVGGVGAYAVGGQQGMGVAMGHPGIAQGMRGGYMAVTPDMHGMAPLRATGFMTTNAGLVPLYSPQDLERWNEGHGTGAGAGALTGSGAMAQTQPMKEDNKDDASGNGGAAPLAAISAPAHAPVTLQQYPLLQQPQPQHLMNVGLGLETGGMSMGIAPNTKNVNVGGSGGGVHPPRFFGISPPHHPASHSNPPNTSAAQPYEDWDGDNAGASTAVQPQSSHEHDPTSHAHAPLTATYYDQQGQPHQSFTTGPPGHTPAMCGY